MDPREAYPEGDPPDEMMVGAKCHAFAVRYAERMQSERDKAVALLREWASAKRDEEYPYIATENFLSSIDKADA